MNRALQAAMGAVLVLAVGGCGDPNTTGFEMPPVVQPGYKETGDFDYIQRHGRLRLLMLRDPTTVDGLPRENAPIISQIDAASRFARSMGLRPVIVLIEHPEDLLTALRDGRGDLVVSNLTIAADYGEGVDFTVALDRTRQMLVARADDPIEQPEDMAGRTITVTFGSRFWQTARNLQDAFPGLKVESLPGLSSQRKMDWLAEGRIDLTIEESNYLDIVLDERSDLRAVFPVSGETGAGWAIREDSPQLRTVLNRYITHHQLAALERDTRTDDLDEIIASGVLRMVTRNSAANYFVWRGQLLGFEYELMREFADRLNVRLEVVVAEDGESILPMLEDGRADVAAAFLTPRAHEGDDSITWSRPYHDATQQVVGDAREREFDDVSDMAGRTFHVRRDSEHWHTLKRLRDDKGVDLELRAVPPDEEPETTLRRIARGGHDLTLADDHIVRNAMIWQENVRPLLDIGEPVQHRWAVRAENPRLLEAVDAYLRAIHRSELYNVAYAKYFRDDERIRSFNTHRVDLDSGRDISPWDDLVRRHAGEYGIDWRLVLAQMFQESGFDPQAQSWVGAVGLMQIMPRTAMQLGVDGELTDPDTNIEAGVRYLDWLKDRFEDDLHVHDRMWFVLAAYNAGIGHVRDARRLAAQLGLDPDRWFDNVEVAMEKLAQREYFQHARFGYVRGHEPVGYVRNIRERYMTYMLWAEDCWPECTPSPHPRTPAHAMRTAQTD